MNRRQLFFSALAAGAAAVLPWRTKPAPRIFLTDAELARALYGREVLQQLRRQMELGRLLDQSKFFLAGNRKGVVSAPVPVHALCRCMLVPNV